MDDLQRNVIRLMAALDNAPNLYADLLEAFAEGTGATFAAAARAGGSDRLELDLFVRKGAERGDRLRLMEAAFSSSEEERKAARRILNEAAWALDLRTAEKKNDAPLYEIIVAADGPELEKEAEGILREGLEMLEPLLNSRLKLGEQASMRSAAINQLRASEEELRRFFEDSKDMIYTTNAEDRFASINNAGLALLGQTNRFDAIGRKFSEFINDPENREYFLSRIRERGFVRDYEYVINNPGGEPLFCLETAHVIKKADGSIAAIQGIVKDISERIKNEKAIWKANLELAETNDRLRETQRAMVQQEKLAAIGQLAAGVAHEINNPIGFMKSNFNSTKEYVSALSRALAKAKQELPAESWERIERAEDIPFILQELPHLFSETGDGYARIIEIVAQLKSFARIDSEAAREPYDMEKGIESSLVIAWNEIKYVADVKRDFGGVAMIEAEGGSVNQVILNILVNAAQAIAAQKRKDRGLIAISTREDDEFLYCLISDDGPGIPEHVKRKIFDPFFTTKEPGKGTGLGLSISYDIIVNKHGGKISVDSEPGNGTRFEIALPRKNLPSD